MYRYKGIEYPALRGKTIKQVLLIEDNEFNALILSLSGFPTRQRFTLTFTLGFGPETVDWTTGDGETLIKDIRKFVSTNNDQQSAAISKVALL